MFDMVLKTPLHFLVLLTYFLKNLFFSFFENLLTTETIIYVNGKVFLIIKLNISMQIMKNSLHLLM